MHICENTCKSKILSDRWSDVIILDAQALTFIAFQAALWAGRSSLPFLLYGCLSANFMEISQVEKGSLVKSI